MKFLITGAGGQLGREWVDFCIENNISYKSYNSSELDISDSSQVQKEVQLHKPDIVINCAAYTKVDDAEDNELQANKINAQSVKNLATICESRNIKLVHFSTDYVFSGDSKDQEQFPLGYEENHQVEPINKYGYSKWLGEKELMESGCSYLLIRVSWLCGKHGNNFVKTMLRLGEERDTLTVVNDQYGSPTFTDQVVKLTHALIRKNEKGIFHISSEGLASWYEFAKEIFKKAEIKIDLKPVSSNEYPTKAKRPSFSKLSTQKISTIDGINSIHWKEGLQRLLNQLK